MIVPFPEYMPDQPILNSPGTFGANNVIPHARSYKPHPSLQTYTTGALTARCQGATAARGTDGTTYVYAGDATKLYNLNTAALTWTDVSRATGGVYSTPSDGAPGWRFQQFGNLLIAVNFADATQVITLGGANFAALGGSPPRAKYITAVRNRIVMANTFDGTDGNVPFRVRWSGLTTAGLGDSTAWDVSATTTADFQDIPADAGAITGIFGGEYGVILQEKAVTRMTFSGTGLVFQFDRIEGVRGTASASAAIQYEDFVYYLGDDGFYAFDGTHSVPIGANRVDRTFFADVDQNYMFRVTAAADPINKVIYWFYPGSGSSGGTPNKGLIFDTVNNKWAAITGTELEILFTAYTVGVNLDSMDALFGTNLDTHPFSLDSAAWVGGKNKMGVFTTAHKMGFFDGSNMEAAITSAEVQLFEGRRAFVTGVRPIIMGGTSNTTMATLSRDTPGGTTTTGSEVSVNAANIAPMRVNARYHRFRATIAAGVSWNDAIGLEVEARPEGRR